MAYLTESFDSYTDGDLNGQGSWSGGTEFDVQGTTTYNSSTKAIINSGTTNASCQKSFSLSPTGYQSWYIRTNDKTKDAVHQTRVYESGSAKLYVKINNGNMQYYNGAAYVTFGTVVNDTWHHIETEWNAFTDQARYRFDGGSWTSWANFQSTMTSGADGFGLVHDGAGSANNYWDNIEATPGGVYPDSTAQGYANASSLTYSHTCSGSNRALVVGWYEFTNARTVSSVTYAGTAMTLLGERAADGTGGYVRLYGLANPASGANNIVITLSGANQIFAGSISFTGADQTTPFPDTAVTATTASSTSHSSSITTSVNNSFLTMIGRSPSDVPVASTETILRQTNTTSGDAGWVLTSQATRATGSNSLAWTYGVNRTSYTVLTAVAPVGAASSIKTVNGLAKASVKTVNGLAIASVKTINGLA